PEPSINHQSSNTGTKCASVLNTHFVKSTIIPPFISLLNPSGSFRFSVSNFPDVSFCGGGDTFGEDGCGAREAGRPEGVGGDRGASPNNRYRYLSVSPKKNVSIL